MLIVDFGTAITIDAVSQKGEYIGGIIAPGIHLSAETLFSRTALLPLISIHHQENVIGKNTVDAINSGIFWGSIGMISYLLEKMSKEFSPQVPLILATGGDTNIMEDHLPIFDQVDPDLTLKGIALLIEENED